MELHLAPLVETEMQLDKYIYIYLDSTPGPPCKIYPLYIVFTKNMVPRNIFKV